MSEQENHMKGRVLLNLQEISPTRHLFSSLHLILSRDPDFQVMVRTVNNMEVSVEWVTHAYKPQWEEWIDTVNPTPLLKHVQNQKPCLLLT